MSRVLERQYLTFTVAEERFALAVGRVREVLEYSQITKLPGQLAYIKGLIDLRGKGVPVIDLRIRFEIPEIGMTRDSAIIVAELGSGAHMTIIGLLVDAVHEVIELESGSVDDPPSFGSRISDLFLRGIARKDKDFILILDAEKLLRVGDLNSISAAEVGDMASVGTRS